MTSDVAAYVPVVRHYTLIIEGANIQEGPSAVWHAWTYNGTVPGPTLYAYVGDTIIVTVYNHLNLIHSFHTHLVNYNFSSDGSQANVIAGIGAGSMIAPGQNYTYYFNATYAGIFFYHCHSSDKFPISYHMAQGLYGIIMVDQSPALKPKIADDFVVTMGELGPQVTGTGAAPYIMDGIGFPGGEPALMNLFAAQGISGVEATINKTLLTFEAKVGETIRFDVIDVGELVHSFHLHDAEIISEFANPGQPIPDAVLGLEPGTADSVLVTLTQPGIFLFHCHVVQHADAGMIGILIVLPANGTITDIPRPANTIYTYTQNTTTQTTNTSAISLSTLTTSTQGVQVSIVPNAGTNESSLGYSPDVINVVIGVNNTVTWTNNDQVTHTVTADDGSFDSGLLEPGQMFVYTFTTAGTYEYHCQIHPWMNGTVIVTEPGG